VVPAPRRRGRAVPPEIDEYVRRSDENLREWEELKAQLDAGEDIELERNDELASQFVFALETGTPMELYGNVRNDALIDGLPDDACVDVPCVVADGAVQPQRIGPIPAQCLALNRTFLNVVELTVRAVLEGSRDLAAGRAPGPEHRRDAHDPADRSDGRRPARGARRADPEAIRRADARLVKHADEVGLRLE
jgi:hypothetical protein